MAGAPDSDDIVDSYLGGLAVTSSKPAPGEWGLALEAGGWPLHVGLRAQGGLLRAQAHVVAQGAVAPERALHLNRSRSLVRVSASRAGDLHVEGDVPLDALDADILDRLLGSLVELAGELRQAARRDRSR